MKDSSIPRIALRLPSQAAQALSMSDESFNKHVRHDLKVIKRGDYTYVTVRELERWSRENEEYVLGDRR